VLASTLPACGSSGPEPAALSGIVRDPAPEVGGLALPDVSRGSERVPLRAKAGGLMLVYFGYTQCPDVCPTTMADVREALAGLGSDRSKVDVAMVTVDPGRDTRRVLTDYVRAFFPEGHAFRTANPKLLARVAKAFGAGYQVGRARDGTVEVAHTAFVYAVDDVGRIRVQWGFGTPSRAIRRDVRALLDARDR
jgi:protein SCO1/2